MICPERWRHAGALLRAAISAHQAGYVDRSGRNAEALNGLLVWPERKALKALIWASVTVLRFQVWRGRRRRP